MSHMIKNMLKIILFISGLCALLWGTSILFQPTQYDKDTGTKDMMSRGIQYQEENTLDAVFLGDSSVFSSFIPLQIWNEYGIATYALGTPAQVLINTKEIVENMLKTQQPKVLILETGVLFREFSYEMILMNAFEETFSVFRYHNRWKKTGNEAWKVDIDTLLDSKGYYYNPLVQGGHEDKDTKKIISKGTVLSRNRSYLEHIKKMCDEKGVQLVLLTVPHSKNWSEQMHQDIVNLANEMNISYIDLNDTQYGVTIDWENDTSDKGEHLNHAGATKVTNFVGKYLKDLNIFEDKRTNSAYTSWNELLKKVSYMSHTQTNTK